MKTILRGHEKHESVLSVLGLLAVLCCDSRLTAEQGADQVQKAIEKSLPFLWQAGQDWVDQRGCVSCHQIPYMVWSLNAASRKGFEVDPQRLADINTWATQIKNFDTPTNRSDRSLAEQADSNLDTMAHLLLALQDVPGDQMSEWSPQFVNLLQEAQQPDGTWKPCGQLPSQKRPASEINESSTLWACLALSTNGKNVELQVAASEVLNKMASSAVSTEWWAARLLLAAQQGRKVDVASCRQKLLEFQNADGGWGWLAEGESDAFGTGLALYSLSRTGPLSSDVQSAAHRFLVTTQREDGSWKVCSTKAKTPQQVTPTAIYWGTAWGVIGLLESVE